MLLDDLLGKALEGVDKEDEPGLKGKADDEPPTDTVTTRVRPVDPPPVPVAPPAATAIANGIPMDLEQMRRYLQELYGVPVVLREQGTVHIKCPFCGHLHDHGRTTGHQVAGCDDDVRYGIGIVVCERYFVPNYGYRVCEYKEGDGVNELIIP